MSLSPAITWRFVAMRPVLSTMKPVPTLVSPASIRTIAGLEFSTMSFAVIRVRGMFAEPAPHPTRTATTNEVERILHDSPPACEQPAAECRALGSSSRARGVPAEVNLAQRCLPGLAQYYLIEMRID